MIRLLLAADGSVVGALAVRFERPGDAPPPEGMRSLGEYEFVGGVEVEVWREETGDA